MAWAAERLADFGEATVWYRETFSPAGGTTELVLTQFSADDINQLDVYRNGVWTGCTLTAPDTVHLPAPSAPGDEYTVLKRLGGALVVGDGVQVSSQAIEPVAAYGLHFAGNAVQLSAAGDGNYTVTVTQPTSMPASAIEVDPAEMSAPAEDVQAWLEELDGRSLTYRLYTYSAATDNAQVYALTNSDETVLRVSIQGVDQGDEWEKSGATLTLDEPTYAGMTIVILTAE